MVGLYKSIDSTFVDLWNRVQRHADPSWLYKMQMDLLQAVPRYIQCTESQAVEIRVTQHWLRAVVWRLCTSRGLMSSLTSDSISYLCPIRIAMDLEVALEGFSQTAVEIHRDSVVSPVAIFFLLFFTLPFVPLHLLLRPVLLATLCMGDTAPLKMRCLLLFVFLSVSGLTFSLGQTLRRYRLLLG